MKKHNFCAGPSLLPSEVLHKASQSIIEYENSGLSILEISHRSELFLEILHQAQELVLELLDLKNKGFQVLFLQGGASMEFLRVPFNLMKNYKKAAYLDTGIWSSKAIVQAQYFGEILIVGSSKNQQYQSIPQEYKIPLAVDYFHCTSNNTIYGTQIKDFNFSKVPMVCDMSSDIFSRVLPFDKFSLIYAGAQKNIGPAGLSLVVVQEDVLEKNKKYIPNIMNYKTHIEHNNLYNTPAIFAIYTSYLNLLWIKNKGGISSLESLNKEKANMLYNEIDRNSFFKATAFENDRSMMNATFVLNQEALTQKWEDFLKSNQIENLKGHRSVGGYRASIYNAQPKESVAHLISTMQEFELMYC